MSKHSLNGKVALIGGGAKNLGGLISRSFAADGAKNVVHYNSDSTADNANRTVSEIEENDGTAFAIQGDFTKPAEVTTLGGLTQIEDIVPLVKFLVTDGWWITSQTIFANGGYTTR